MLPSSIGRRGYLKAVGGSIAAAGVAGTTATASTADQVTVTGKLESYDGDPVAGRKVYFRNGGGSEYIDTDSSGVFETKADADSYASLGFYKSGNGQLHAPVKNGVPHIDELGRYRVGNSDTDLGTISLERGYLVNLRALDEDGNPVTDAEFGFGADGYGSSSYLLSANEKGYLVINNADFTGIELAESANVAIKIPTGSDAQLKYKESIHVDGPMTVIAQEGQGTTIKESKPEDSTTTTTQTPTETTTTTTTTTTSSTATPTTTTETTSTATKTTVSTTSQQTTKSETESKMSSNRGFFSNGESAGNFEFLSNPFFLTFGGFVLSIAGIGMNLLRGR